LKVLYEDPKLGFQVIAHARSRRLLGDLWPGDQTHRHDRMGARG
jgi:hypothetical protein